VPIAMVMMLAGALPPRDEELNAAIWNDLQMNAMIGNHNDAVGWDWFFGHEKGRPPTITIIDLACKGRGYTRNCTFDLSRAPHPAATDPDEIREEPLLTCKGRFRLWGEGDQRVWSVIHTPGEGHSRTTLQCKAKRTKAYP